MTKQFHPRWSISIVHPFSKALPWCILALFCLISGCQTNTSTQNKAALKLGTVLPLTGDLEQFGPPMQDTSKLLVKTVNDCGGVLGQPVTLISEDDQTEPYQGEDAMFKLAETDQVAGVIGALSSSVSYGMVELAADNQVMQISPGSTSPLFTQRAQNNEFDGYWARTVPPDTLQARALAQLAKSLGFKTVSILTINNDYGNDLSDEFIADFQALGGKVLDAEFPARYDPFSDTFEEEVKQAFSGNPNAILLIAYPETGSEILQTAKQLNLLNSNTQILGTDTLFDDKFPKLVGKDDQGQLLIAGMIGTTPRADGPGLKAFQELYQSAFQREPDAYDPQTWDATALMVLATEAAKDATGTGIRNSLRDVANPPGTEVSDICQSLELIRKGEAINYQGASGEVDLDQAGDVSGNYDVWEVQPNGEIQIKNQIKAEQLSKE